MSGNTEAHQDTLAQDNLELITQLDGNHDVAHQVANLLEGAGKSDYAGLLLHTESGRRYEVIDSARVTVNYARFEPIGKVGVFMVGQGFDFGNKPVHVEKDNRVEQLSVLVSNVDGEPEYLYVINEDDFTDFLGDSRRDKFDYAALTGVSEDEATPEADTLVERSLDIDSHDANFESISSKVEDLCLGNYIDSTNWAGLAWNSRSTTYRVAEDKVLYDRTAEDIVSVTRSIVVKKYDSRGNLRSIDVVSDYDIDKYLEKSKTAGGIHNLRLSKPEYIEEAISQEDVEMAESELRETVEEQTQGLESQGETSLTPDEKAAIWLMSYVDVIDDNDPAANDKRTQNMAELASNLESQRRIKALSEMIEKYGLFEVVKTAQEIRQHFEQVATKMQFKLSGEFKSVSWAVEDMTDYYYFSSSDKDVAGDAYEGFLFSDPMADDIEATKAQRRIVDAHLGNLFVISNGLIKTGTKAVPTGKVSPVGLPHHTEKPFVNYDEDVLNSAPKLGVIEVAKISESIYKEMEKGKQPKQVLIAQVGRWLSRGVGC